MAPAARAASGQYHRPRPGKNAHGLVISVHLILVCGVVTGLDSGCDRLKHGGE